MEMTQDATIRCDVVRPWELTATQIVMRLRHAVLSATSLFILAVRLRSLLTV